MATQASARRQMALDQQHLVNCEFCRTRLPDRAAYHGYINHPLHFTLCEPCALDFVGHLQPALILAEAQRIVRLHQQRLGGAQ